MNALVKHEAAALPALQMSEAELVDVLTTSLYPGAKVNSIKMVLGYCRATGLDPMQKPVHIVPMWDSASKSMRDVVMPGVGMYRTQAARSGAYAGVTEPEFGPDVTEEFAKEQDGERSRPAVTVTYPSSCKVTVKRQLPDGQIAEFTATERWKENYATASKSSKQPNAMWTKRPYGQLAKCAEAQALRKAFPEIGAQPTADEMEGKTLDEGVVIDASTGEISGGKKEATALPPYPDDKFKTNLPAWLDVIAKGRKTADQIIGHIKTMNTLSAEQEKLIRGGKPAAASAAPSVTAAEVLAKIEAAQTSDDLDVAASLISAVPEAERAALNARYDELQTKFNPQE